MINLWLVACAFCGGIIASLMLFFDDPAESRRISPHIYWGKLLLFNPFCGSFLVTIYLADGATISHTYAAGVGLGAPLIIKQLIRSITGTVLKGSDVEL